MALRVAIVSVDGVGKPLPPGDFLDGVSSAWNSSSGITSLSTPTDRVGIGTAVPSTKAKLQVDSTTQGFLPPRMTTAQRDAITSPPAGLIIFNTTTSSIETYSGSAWVNLYGGESYRVEHFTTTGTDGSSRGTISGNLYVDLAEIPINASKVCIDVIGGTTQANVLLSGSDFTVIDAGAGQKRVSWAAYDMGLTIINGTTFRVIYPISSTGSLRQRKVYPYTLTGTDISNKYKDLPNIPVTDTVEFYAKAGNHFYPGDNFAIITDGADLKRLTWDATDPSVGEGITNFVSGDKVVVAYAY